MKLSIMPDKKSISTSHLEQIFTSLRFKDLVKGQRGLGGGYVLEKQADEISIAEIISGIDEWVEYNFIKPKIVVQISHSLMTHILRNDLSHQIFDFLDSTNLVDVVANISADQKLLKETA